MITFDLALIFRIKASSCALTVNMMQLLTGSSFAKHGMLAAVLGWATVWPHANIQASCPGMHGSQQ
jgi:hypothetical protein